MAYGDATGNDALAIRDILRGMGYKSEIYAEFIGSRLENEKIMKFEKMSLKPDDVLIYHMSVGSRLSYLIETFKCKKIMIYHNITPSNYFLGYDIISVAATKKGLDEVRYLNNKFDYCLADSEYNKQDLIEYGYTCDIDVLPIVVPFSDYEKKPSKVVLRKYTDSMTNLLFVGRVVPNKKIENIIAAFYHYQKKFNPISRLFLVGHWNGMERYKSKLDEYIKVLGINNIVFTGHIKFDEILAYYRLADVFVCMSEHEGFCVPLVEAMFFDIPIVAASHAAVPYTLGGSGILLDEESPLLAAGAIDLMVTDTSLRKVVIDAQRNRLNDFSHAVVKSQFETYVGDFLRGER